MNLKMVVMLVIFCFPAMFVLGSSNNDTEYNDSSFHRIVGGVPANIRDYPYQVALLVNGNLECGGSLISARWVVSAAHCTFRKPPSTFMVRAGSTFSNSGGEVILVRHIFNHPYYDPFSTNYDLALILLHHPVTTPYARPIKLAEAGVGPINAEGFRVTVTGWGSQQPRTQSQLQVLQVVHVFVVGHKTCFLSYPELTNVMFCAGYLGIGGRDSCQGDSGGPAVNNGLLYGVISWGHGCARPNKPGVYANIPAMRRWIWEKTGI